MTNAVGINSAKPVNFAKGMLKDLNAYRDDVKAPALRFLNKEGFRRPFNMLLSLQSLPLQEIDSSNVGKRRFEMVLDASIVDEIIRDASPENKRGVLNGWVSDLVALIDLRLHNEKDKSSHAVTLVGVSDNPKQSGSAIVTFEVSPLKAILFESYVEPKKEIAAGLN